MANFTIKDGLLLEDNKVFIPSTDINIFPCARRGQNNNGVLPQQYDPEARLNTERTNRLHTAINGFKDSFIISEDFTTSGTFTFVIAGHHVEVKKFNPATIANILDPEAKQLYAYLCLQPNISLDSEGYATEILFRQAKSENDSSYLDVTYEAGKDFFTGVSFVTILTNMGKNDYYLPLFKKTNTTTWELVQTSLLPKIEHDNMEDSIAVGETHVRKNLRVDEDVTISGSLTANDTFTASATDKKVTISADSGLEVIKTALINDLDVTNNVDASTLNINEYINIGNPTNATETTGDLVAKNDITAEHDLIAKNSAYVKAGLVVGNDNSTLPAGEIKATSKVSTPDLQVNTITSTNENIVVNKPLDVNGGISLTGGITSENGKFSIKDLQVTNNAAINDLDVTTNIDTTTLKATESIETPLLNIIDEGKISTPTVETTKITSTDTEIVVDKVLKVDNGLTVEQATTLNKTLTVDGATTINSTITAEKLVITDKDADGTEKGEIDTPQLRVNRITSNEGSITIDNKKLIVNKSLEMLAKTDATDPATATVEKAIIGDLTVKVDSKLKSSTGKITAKEVVADKITQNGNAIPAIALSQVGTTRVYQLQITLDASKQEQN